MTFTSSKKQTPPNCSECKSCGSSVFSSLSHEILDKLGREKTYALYKKGQVVFCEGNIPSGLFCINTGKVKIHKLGSDGREQIVRFAKPGNVIGYRAMLSDDRYFATATALEDTSICFYPKSSYLELLKSDPEISLQTIKILASDLRSAEMMITNMAHKQVKERVAEALLLLKSYYGLADDKETINAVVTREEIANIAGTSTETSIRTLANLKNENVLILQGKKIRIIDLDKLERIAHPLEH